MDPLQHKRFLDYRERHQYFGAGKRKLAAEEFIKLDEEQRALEQKDPRTDEEEARFAELCALLFRD